MSSPTENYSFKGATVVPINSAASTTTSPQAGAFPPRDSPATERKALGRIESVNSEDPNPPSGEDQSFGSSDLSKQDVIFSYDSLWNKESIDAWSGDKALRLEDVEGVSGDSFSVRRRLRGGKDGEQDIDPGPPHLLPGDSAGSARFVRAVGKYNPRTAEFVASMLSSQVEATSLQGSGLQLSLPVLVEQFFLQMLFPWHLPVTTFLYQPAALRNMEMSFSNWKEPSAITGAVIHTLVCILSLAPIIAFYGFPDTVPAAFRVEVWMLLGTFTAQELVVALKYATMPAHAYEVIMTRDVPQRVRRSEQLISGWLRPSSIVLTREIIETASRLGIDLESVKFTFQPAARDAVNRLFHAVERLLPASLHVDYDPECEVPMSYVVFSILAREVVRRKTTKISVITSLLSAVMAFLFPLLRSVNGAHAFGSTGLEMALLAINSVCAFFWMLSLVTFLFVGILDFNQRCKTQQALGALISRKRNRCDGRFFEPIIDLTASPNNVSSFVLARRLLLSVGERYSYRIQQYTSLIAFTTLAFGVALLVMSVTGASNDVWGAFEVLTLVETALVGIVLLIMVTIGASANHRSEEHAALLSARQMELRQHIVAYRAVASAFSMHKSKIEALRQLAQGGGPRGAAAAAMLHHLTGDPLQGFASPGPAHAGKLLSSLGSLGMGSSPRAATATVASSDAPDVTTTIPLAPQVDTGPDVDQRSSTDETEPSEPVASPDSKAAAGNNSPAAGTAWMHTVAMDAAVRTMHSDSEALRSPALASREEGQGVARAQTRAGPSRLTSRKSSGTTAGARRSQGSAGRRATLKPSELLAIAEHTMEGTDDGSALGPSGAPLECELNMVLWNVEDVDRLLTPAKEAILADAKMRPVRLLGFPATMNLLRTAVVVLSTSVSLAVRLLWL